ncbi:hydroxymethylglutaryl-CoA reductase [Gamsiella multidivaricata]|uniref:hydroxymethylglutaryl-CoA reductase n=1 Tax=Gamsiella multidivaricata TaxID=101098 RepID=UPI00221F6E1E|nr:hydroxymethylglutaryl-CoA reductase [Gamsiella multidivaricata]KAI7824291.1 hydroxymethylglutaryl-CoA reductase [Gamsiella multidivaricata]
MIGSPDGTLLEGDLSLDARLDALIATEQEGAPLPVFGLDEQIANNMIENCIGTMGLPLGLAFNFSINGSPLVIPMAIEEPSVVAAVSSAAKTISTYQGFQAWAPERNMIVAQVQLIDIQDNDMDQVMARMQHREKVIREEANEYCTNMVLRGGGVQKVTFHRVRRHASRESFQGQDLLVKYGVVSASTLPKRTERGITSQGRCSEWLVVHLHIDVGDAMGANCANTVAEGVAPFLSKLSGGRVGVRILSNLNVDRIAKSMFRLPFSHMGYKSLSGKDVAVRILEAYEWADLDPYRAATHNKGIMNGIDAVALATGQDWRAVEAGAHAWASGAGTYSERSTDAFSSPLLSSSANSPASGRAAFSSNGTNENDSHTTARKRQFGKDGDGDQQSRISRGDAYKPLTRYWIEEDAERLRQGYKGQDALVFCGELEIPIMVGTKGGVLSTNPVHAFTLGVMRYPDSKQLAMAMVTVGLAQNFAALRALVTEGIQRGHMALHARNIAISAGTPPDSVDEVTAYMIDTGKIRLSAARLYIEQRRLALYTAGTGIGIGMSVTAANTSSVNLGSEGTSAATNGMDGMNGTNHGSSIHHGPSSDGVISDAQATERSH